MKLISAAFCFAAICAVGLDAQTQTTTTTDKTKIEVEKGREVTVSGCVEPNPGGGYMLTNDVGDMKYALVTDDNLSKYVGRRVEVKGKAADRGDAKVKIESKTKIEDHGHDREAHSKTEAAGNMPGMTYLGVKSMKTLSSSCR